MSFSPGRDQGTAQAYADELLLRFGDDLDMDDDLDEDDYSDSDLEDDLDAEFGVDDEDEDRDEGFGGISSFPSRVLSAEKARYGKGLLSGLGKTFSVAADFSASAAQGLSSSGYNPLAPSLPVSVHPTPVSDRETLPPVYVVDPSLAAQTARSLSVGSPFPLSPTTKFGASFQEGFVRPRAGQDREAAIRAKLEGSKELRNSSLLSPSPMVEDPTALPVLFSDGSVREPIYGSLSLVPCPSCHSLSRGRYGSSGNGCVVCDDYGAILSPTSDIPNIASSEHFGFVAALLTALAPLATHGGQIGGQAAAERKQAQAADASARASKVYARLQKQLEAQKSMSKNEEAPSSDSSAKEIVSGIGGFLGGLDDLEDLDTPEEFGEDFDEDDDEDDDDDDDDDDDGDDGDDDDDDDEDDDSDLSSEGRIVRVLFPRGRF